MCTCFGQPLVGSERPSRRVWMCAGEHWEGAYRNGVCCVDGILLARAARGPVSVALACSLPAGGWGLGPASPVPAAGPAGGQRAGHIP